MSDSSESLPVSEYWALVAQNDLVREDDPRRKLIKALSAKLAAVELACSTIENLTVPKATSSWHIAGEKSAVRKIRAAMEES